MFQGLLLVAELIAGAAVLVVLATWPMWVMFVLAGPLCAMVEDATGKRLRLPFILGAFSVCYAGGSVLWTGLLPTTDGMEAFVEGLAFFHVLLNSLFVIPTLLRGTSSGVPS